MATSISGASALTGDVAPVTAAPLTLAAWVRVPEVPSDLRGVLHLARIDTAEHWFALSLNGGFPNAQAYGGGVNGGVVHPSSIVAGRWHHIAAVFASTTSRTPYLDGVAGPPDTTSVIPASIGRATVGARWRQGAGAFQNVFPGEIAFPAIWGAALTPPEITALAAGARPETIRPNALAETWPLPLDQSRRVTGARRGLALTAIGPDPTWADDPPRVVAIPRAPALSFLSRVAAAVRWHAGHLPGVFIDPPTTAARPRRWYPGLSRRDSRRRTPLSRAPRIDAHGPPGA